MRDSKYNYSFTSYKDQNQDTYLDNHKKIQLSPKKILVIDDDLGILEALQAILEYGGFEVALDDGQDIENKVEKQTPDLILMDVSLGVRNGITVCNKLKNDPKTRMIPVILISAHYNLYNLSRLNQADDFIAKPFDMSALLNKISSFLGKE
jgi:CheY-like chemotaxis protein